MTIAIVAAWTSQDTGIAGTAYRSTNPEKTPKVHEDLMKGGGGRVRGSNIFLDSIPDKDNKRCYD